MVKHLNRRIFLRGLAGAVVASPFLSSLAGRSANAQPVPAAGPAKRVIVMFTHYGCITTRFFPTKSHGPLSAADLQSTTLAPLAPFVQKLLIPRGIRAMNEWTSTMVRGQGNDIHTQVVGSYFTCQPVTPNTNNPFDFNPATKLQAMPTGPSLDHVIAQQLSPGGTPLLMRVANVSENPMSAISYSAATTRYPGLGTPAAAYSQLTGLFAPGAAISPASYQAVRGKSIIDLVRDDLDTLERFEMSQADKLKLEAWKELLHQTGTVIASSCSADVAAQLGAMQANIDAVSNAVPNTDPLMSKITDDLDGADIYSAVAVLAAACNENPVIVLMYPPDYVFKGLGLAIDSDSLAKRVGDSSLTGTCAPDVIGMPLKIDGYYAAKFAKLIGMLDGIPEGDGTTTLDNTAAVWFQEFSDGCAHNLNNLPIIQAGSAGGYFKTGWAVNVENGSANLSNGNSELRCTDGNSNTVDADDQLTGTDPSLANAPINKYYCNLINALGVKAGDDGFPAKGGAAEVIRFGMYDKTEDFIGGGTNPAKINSPGGFDALKANV
ncbi:MAG: DUF1552 domain-containing protein [Pseudomonadota bacterium]